MKFRSVARTHVGLVRTRNEDAILNLSGAGLWAVSDGMGGHAAGDVASTLVINRLEAVAMNGGESGYVNVVRNVLMDANAELFLRGLSPSLERNMGATVTVLSSDDTNFFFCLWAGDSRLYRHRDGKLIQLTHDHRYVRELIDSGLLSEKEAESDPRRGIITRAVGVASELDLDMCNGTIATGDVFVLVTDGVTEVCSDGEIAQILSRHDIEHSADAIVDLCLERGAPDNLSLILVSCA